MNNSALPGNGSTSGLSGEEELKPLAAVMRAIADEEIDGLHRPTWRAAWLAAARIVEEARPVVPTAERPGGAA